MKKVALVGVGGMGTGHYNLYRKMEDVELVALCDVRPEQVAEKVKESDARAYVSLTELLAKESPEIVDICTPSYTHADLAVEALRHGCHVLCEKPAALRREDVKRVYQTARENGVYFMAAHVIRFWGEYCWLRQAVEQKTYGALRHARFWRMGEKPTTSWQNWMLDPAKSGMVPFDLHVHDTDFIVYLLGMPEDLHSFEVRDGETTNYIHTCYRYPAGLEVEAEAGWYTAKYPFSMGYQVIFDGGVAEYREDRLTFYPNGGEPKVIDLSAQTEDMGINVERADGYYNEIRYFLKCVEDRTEPTLVREEQLLDVLSLLERECGASHGK